MSQIKVGGTRLTPNVVLALIPYVYVVWRKRNIGIVISVHCLLNTIGVLISAPAFLR